MRAVFLDRDGVINRDSKDYIRSFDQFEYLPGAHEAFGILGGLPLPIVVVTNQSGLARGYTTPDDVTRIHDKLRRDVTLWGASLAAIEFCPHHPDDGCRCRKPGPGMFEQAAERLDLELSGSYMVGDAPTDMQAGLNLRMTTVRVRTGRGEQPGPPTDHHVEDLLAAAHTIARLEKELLEGPTP